MKTYLILAACTATLLTGACSKAKEKMGLNREAPDEFAVIKRAPLELPPNYALRPPKPGAARPQEQSPEQQAQVAVFGAEPEIKTQVRASTSSEGAFLTEAGAGNSNDNIRRIVDSESKDFGKENQPVVQKLLGVAGKEYTPSESVLNPAEEAQRIKENSVTTENNDAAADKES